MVKDEQIEELDGNNTKCLQLVHLIISALENGVENFDVVTNLEIIRDYLTKNDLVFDM